MMLGQGWSPDVLLLQVSLFHMGNGQRLSPYSVFSSQGPIQLHMILLINVFVRTFPAWILTKRISSNAVCTVNVSAYSPLHPTMYYTIEELRRSIATV